MPDLKDEHLSASDEYHLEDSPEKLNTHNNLSAKCVSARTLARVLNPSSRRIQNPLAGIPRETLLANVDQFASEQQLEDIRSLLRKGALIAQDPPAFESITELAPEERDAIRNEVLHKWRQPRALYLTVILCSVGAAVQCARQPSPRAPC